MRNVLIAAVVAATAALPAGAATFNPFDSFSATPGTTSPFTYGSFNITNDVFTPFTAGGPCVIAGTICQSAGGLPGVYKTTQGAFQTGTVLVPANALLFHPGSASDGSNSVAIQFTAPATATYTFTGSAFVADTNPNQVNVSVFPGVTRVALGSLTAANPTISTSGTFALTKGRSIDLVFDNNGLYFNNSTGLNLSVSGAVPEAATWFMMTAGFGMVGFAARRRRMAITAA